MEIANKKILVVGLARTGIAAARFLRRRGATVRATDMAAEAALGPGVAELRALDIDLALGGHRAEDFTAADLIVLSPGVPHTLAPLQAARGRGVPVIGEVELAARFIREPIVAVSGTNGKTTVTELLGRMLEASGRRVFVGGNIGRPLIGYVDGGQTADVVVAEISSFQLDTIATFRPAVGVLLNITDDHLDRYTDFAAYARSKMRLFENQTAQDTAVLNGADPVIRAQAAAIRSRRLFYNTAEDSENCAAVSGTALALRLPGREAVRLDLAPFRLRGPHNVENACAAALAALAAGASPSGIQQALSAFAPLPHRIESVGVVKRRRVRERLEGDQRRCGPARPGLLCNPGGPDHGRFGQGRQLPAARDRRPPARQGPRAGGQGQRHHPGGTGRSRPDRPGPGHGGGGGGGRRAGCKRRRGAALPRLRQLRHVSELSSPRGGLPAGGPAA